MIAKSKVIEETILKKCQCFNYCCLKKNKTVITKTLEENFERFDHTVYMLKIITKSKIHIKDQEDFKKFDNGHTLSL